MARGKQKLEAQKKNQENKKNSKGSQIEARAASFHASCPICKAQLTSETQLKQHFEARHPGKELPKLEQ